MSNVKPQNICVVGAGYVGGRVAQQAAEFGDRVSIVARESPAIADRLEQKISLHWCDPLSENLRLLAQQWDTLLVSVSHSLAKQSETELTNDHPTGLANVISAMINPPLKILYLSTTGVYKSDDDGAWSNESSPCQPQRPGSQNAYAAEKWLETYSRKNPQVFIAILRPAGIYGPLRIPNLDALRSGQQLQVEPTNYLNLIHVDDLVSFLLMLIQTTRLPGLQIYNLCDGQPPTRREYYSFIADRIGAQEPVFAANDFAHESRGKTIRTRGQGSKRVSNAKLKRDFDFNFRFPDYQSGLESLLGE